MSIIFFHCNQPLCFMVRAVLTCKATADGGNVKCRHGLSVGGLDGSLPQIMLVPHKFGYSVRALLPHTCLIPLNVRSNCSHEKRFSRPRSPKGLHKREKNRNQNIQKQGTMRVRRMTIEQGRRVQIDRFPNFHKTGSVRGMKRLYYGESCLLIRCGQYYYNVTAEPHIYYQAKI